MTISKAPKYDLHIQQGDTFSVDFNLDRNSSDYDLTGATIYGTIRDKHGADGFTEFDVAYPSRTAGQFRLSLTAAKSTALNPGTAVYDIELHVTQSGLADQVTRLLEGKAIITPAVTTQR